MPSFAPQVKAGQLRGLAVTADKRTPALPDVRSMGELGIAGMAGDTFQSVFAPAGIPKAILSRLHGEIMKALAHPESRILNPVVTAAGTSSRKPLESGQARLSSPPTREHCTCL